MNDELKPCPCGKTPTKLHIETGATCKYSYASGDCCGEWLIEFRTHYLLAGTDGAMELAVEAWNEADRKEPTK
mgnify:CR=1 FL=1